jgi:hypothetical protein
MKLSKYIIQVDEELANLFEEIGCTIYPIGDGTYYSIDEDAPQEAHDLAISAIEGYPDAVDEVRGFEVTKSSLPTSKNKTLAGQIRKMKE